MLLTMTAATYVLDFEAWGLDVEARLMGLGSGCWLRGLGVKVMTPVPMFMQLKQQQTFYFTREMAVSQELQWTLQDA